MPESYGIIYGVLKSKIEDRDLYKNPVNHGFTRPMLMREKNVNLNAVFVSRTLPPGQAPMMDWVRGLFESPVDYSEVPITDLLGKKNEFSARVNALSNQGLPSSSITAHTPTPQPQFQDPAPLPRFYSQAQFSTPVTHNQQLPGSGYSRRERTRGLKSRVGDSVFGRPFYRGVPPALGAYNAIPRGKLQKRRPTNGGCVIQ